MITLIFSVLIFLIICNTMRSEAQGEIEIPVILFLLTAICDMLIVAITISALR